MKYSPAQPIYLEANNAIINVPTNIDQQLSYITFINKGKADGTIDFGDGNVAPLSAGESLTCPMWEDRMD